MDRFFTFMKDFGLTHAKIDGTTREVLDKQEVVLLFKKATPNCKDLNFEQFIALLDKVAVLYYHDKEHYAEKASRLAKQRKIRKVNYIKGIKRRKAALEAAQNFLNSREQEESPAEPQEDEDEDEDKKTQQEEPVDDVPQENDGLVAAMLNDKNITDPNR